MLERKEKIVISAKLDVAKANLYQIDNRLFVLSQLDNYLYDISDRLNPKLLSTFNLSKGPKDTISFLGIVDKKAYFSIAYNVVQVIDFENECDPLNIGMMEEVLIGGRWGFLPHNFFITNLKTPVIYQINLPSCMSIVYEFRDEFIDFVLVNNNLICATLSDGIKVYDISQPAKPSLISSLKLNAVKLVVKDCKFILAEGVDGNIYILEVSNLNRLEIATKVQIPGPIASNSMLCQDDYLFVRYMQKTVGDTILAFNLTNIVKPKKIFEFTSVNTPQYLANNKILLLVGVKGWDGVSSLLDYTKSLYKIFSIEPEAIRHIDDIELDGIWFGSVAITDCVVYLGRPDEINIYKIRCDNSLDI